MPTCLQVRATAIAVAMAGATCEQPVTRPTASPVAVGTSEGAVVIEFVRATPDPGSTVINCGADLRGCLGEVTITVRLLSRVDGGVSMVTGTLHGDSKVACLSATSPPAVPREPLLGGSNPLHDRCGIHYRFER